MASPIEHAGLEEGEEAPEERAAHACDFFRSLGEVPERSPSIIGTSLLGDC